jgi:hypothetical protein
MAQTISSLDDVQGYLQGVIGRADHHAQRVSGIVLPLLGAILLHKDVGTDIQVATREGNTANVLWCYFGGRRYAFSYRHDDESVVLKMGGVRGDVIATFNDGTTLGGINTTLRGLARGAAE